jgi:hypothetical protein
MRKMTPHTKGNSKLSKNLHVKTPGKNVGKKISFNIVLGRKNF